MENFETKEARDRASRKTEQSLGAAGGNLGLARRGPEGGEDGAGKAWSRDNGQAFGELAENVYLEVPNMSNSKPARRGRGTKKPSRGPRTSTAENQTQGGTWKPTSDQRVKRWCQRQEAATTTTKATVLELSVR